MSSDEESLLSSIARDLKALRSNVATLTTTVNGLENKIMEAVRTTVKQETKQISEDLALFKGRMDNMEARLNELTGNAGTDFFNMNTSVVIINLAQHDNENTAVRCQELLDTLPVDATVVKAQRTKSRGGKPGLIKCQLTSLNEKISVLQNKKSVKEIEEFKHVHIARMKSHEERLIEINFKTILKDMPNGSNYRFSGSGRLVSKSDEASGYQGNDTPVATALDEASAGIVGQDPAAPAPVWPRDGGSSPIGRGGAQRGREATTQQRTTRQQRGRGGRGGNQGARGGR